MAIKHTKTSAIPDGPDAAQVQPSDWNDDHTLPVSAERLLGNPTGVSAEVAELSLGSGLVFGTDSLELQLKTINGASVLGAGDIVIEGGGGLTYFEESRSVASPNATVPVHALTALGAETNIDFVIAPKGAGGVSVNVPDGTAAGGNKRGANSLDLQSVRGAATQVAGGQFSAVIGGNNTASNTGTLAMGYANVASNQYCVAIGFNSEATGAYAVVLGANSVANGRASLSTGDNTTTRGVTGAISEGFSAILGRRQMQRIPLRYDTTGAVPTTLTVDGGSPSTLDLPVMPNDSAYYCRVRVLARNISTNESMSWSGTALIKRGANAAATTLVGSSIASDFGDAAMSACTVTLSADTTFGALAVTVTGLAATTIRWVAQLETVEAA